MSNPPDQRRHPHRRREVDRTEDDRLEPRRGGADLLDVDQAPSRLDLGFDADVAGREAAVDLDLGEQQVHGHDLGGALHLRQHDLVQAGPGLAHDFDHVAVGPLGVPGVDPDAQHGVAPVLLARRRPPPWTGRPPSPAERRRPRDRGRTCPPAGWAPWPGTSRWIPGRRDRSAGADGGNVLTWPDATAGAVDSRPLDGAA